MVLENLEKFSGLERRRKRYAQFKPCFRTGV
jgi:hypothetical protein